MSTPEIILCVVQKLFPSLLLPSNEPQRPSLRTLLHSRHLLPPIILPCYFPTPLSSPANLGKQRVQDFFSSPFFVDTDHFCERGFLER